jgi:hypothetical protein
MHKGGLIVREQLRRFFLPAQPAEHRMLLSVISIPVYLSDKRQFTTKKRRSRSKSNDDFQADVLSSLITVASTCWNASFGFPSRILRVLRAFMVID